MKPLTEITEKVLEHWRHYSLVKEKACGYANSNCDIAEVRDMINEALLEQAQEFEKMINKKICVSYDVMMFKQELLKEVQGEKELGEGK
jgi:hypothetical protein